jgi:two-component system, chemotaxis family, CheB/CheR fusion protein
MGVPKKGEKTPGSLVGYTFPVVGIGASAGGLDALRRLLENLPINTGLAFVIVQHLAAGQESMLAEILSRSTKMLVQKVQSGMEVEPNHVYVIPSGKILTIKHGVLKLQPKGLSLKPIDEFLRSLAIDRKTRAIGIVLSGTGTDGTEGLQIVKSEGGITFAQEPQSAQYPDMPKNAISAEAVYFILSPEKMGAELNRIAFHPDIVRSEIETAENQVRKETSTPTIFGLLKASFGVNFANYKGSTTSRRISRRMVLNKIETTKAYVAYLRTNHNELEALFEDLLINVTKFFREPDTFLLLKEKVFPDLINKMLPNQTIRVWIPGCSTGEEVYSFAIAIEEFRKEKNVAELPIQIFGTDVNQKNVEKARRGIYLKNIEDNVSQTRLERFFTSVNGYYQVTKQIRDMCVFAKHDISKDPSFSNLDLILCRNVLIYFDVQLHERIMPMLHYALKPNGYLVLGESESVGKFTFLFEAMATKGVVFKKKPAQVKLELQQESPTPYPQVKCVQQPRKSDSLTILREEVDHLLIAEHVPASLVLNANLDIFVFRGRVNPYILVDSGDASLNVSKIVRKELRPALQTAVYKAKKTGETIRELVRLVQGKKTRTIQIQVKPIESSKNVETFFLVIFEETVKRKLSGQKNGGATENVKVESAKDQQIKELSDDLESTKQRLQTVVEQQEATNEELRSSLEEVQSSNEEIMSTNEELETAKEELQSTNEELSTLNDELKNRNASLSLLYDDLANLEGSVDTAVVIVDNDFKIRRFNSSAEDLLRLVPSDVNRSIVSIRLGLPIEDLGRLLTRALNFEAVREEIETINNRWHQMRIKPYLTQDKKVAGLVISFADVTEIKKLEDKLMVVSSFTRHDVRNKLLAVNGNLFLAKKLARGQPELEKYLNQIPDTVAKIDRILDVSKSYEMIGSQKIEFIDVGKSFNDAALLFADFKKIEMINEVRGFKVLADQMLSTVFCNLLDNTLKYGKKVTRIRIYTEQQPNGSTKLIYEDDGVGISFEDKMRLFEQGYGKGTGLGLFLIKRSCYFYGWTISENGEPGKGARFIIEIPATDSKPKF